MWSIKEVKARGKAAFKSNYWPTALVAFLMAVFVGAGFSAAGNSTNNALNDNIPANYEQMANADGGDVSVEATKNPFVVEVDGEEVNILESEYADEFVVLLAGIVGVALFVSWLFYTLADIFLINPLEVGCRYFFARNEKGEARISDIKRGFTPGYMSNVKTLFLRDLFLYLWSLLFLIPGFVKAYSYRMVPYIIAEHPEMGAKEAISLSRKMMDGNKMKSFLLDLSFIGWHILGFLTFGLLEAFYVAPYYASAEAELYQTLAAAQPELAK